VTEKSGTSRVGHQEWDREVGHQKCDREVGQKRDIKSGTEKWDKEVGHQEWDIKSVTEKWDRSGTSRVGQRSGTEKWDREVGDIKSGGHQEWVREVGQRSGAEDRDIKSGGHHAEWGTEKCDISSEHPTTGSRKHPGWPGQVLGGSRSYQAFGHEPPEPLDGLSTGILGLTGPQTHHGALQEPLEREPPVLLVTPICCCCVCNVRHTST
jgi:hypothetical protein